MGLFSLTKIFGLTIRESANDGSDFTNPDADYRRLFLGEDGALHVKDSAGSVTTIGGGSVATDAIWDAAGDLAVGTGANTAAKLSIGSSGHVLTSNGTTAAWAAPSGGSSDAIPTIEAYAENGASSTSLGVTISSAASGKRLIVAVASTNRDVNTPTCTNVTFTEVGATNFSTTAYVSVYVGVVAGGSSGTTVTITATGSNFIFAAVATVADTLTPTGGSAVTLTNTDASSLSNSRGLTAAFTRGTFYVFVAHEDNGGTPLRYSITAPYATLMTTNAWVGAIGYAPGGSFTVTILAGTGSADFAGLLVPVT